MDGELPRAIANEAVLRKQHPSRRFVSYHSQRERTKGKVRTMGSEKNVEKLTGTVEALFITASASKPMQFLAEVEAIAGQGLADDRYLKGTGYYSERPQGDGGRQITLVETEELEKLKRDTGILLDPAESRRNVLTRFISVNDLIGERFRIGEVLCEGIRICEPCTYLEKLTGKRVMRPLVHRGGLRAKIISGGIIRVGDEIRRSPEASVEETKSEVADVHNTDAQNVGKADFEEIQAEGTLRKLGSTHSVGGTHYLESSDAGSVRWFLQSEELELDDFLELKVRVLGYKIKNPPAVSSKAKLMSVFLVTSV